MPIPKPRDDEDRETFLKRCMADDVMGDEYEETDQRYAICNSQWRTKEAEKMHEYKTLKFKVESFNEETGEFEGIASAFRKMPDKLGDIVDPGAFTKTIQENGGEVMLTFPPHDLKSPVGKGVIRESEKGLHVKGTLLRGIQKAEEAYILMKAGVVRSLSMGYDPIKEKMEGSIRHLKEVRLYEIGLVPGNIAADDQARILTVKSEIEGRIDELEEELKSGRVFSRRNVEAIMHAVNTLITKLKEAGVDPDAFAEEGEEKIETKQGNIQNLIDAWDDWAGSYNACVRVLSDKPGITDPEALCAWMHHEAEGEWPGEKGKMVEIINRAKKLDIKPDMEILKTLPHRMEPSHDTLEDEEAVKLEAIHARLEGFDLKKAEARIDELLNKIGR